MRRLLQGDAAAMGWLTNAPGGVLRAVRVGVVATDAEATVVGIAARMAKGEGDRALLDELSLLA